MDEVKKLFNRKSSQKELGESSNQEATASRWRRRSQSRNRNASGQKTKNLESSPYDAQPEGDHPTQGSEPLHGNATSGARDRNSTKQLPDTPPSTSEPTSGIAAPTNSARPTSAFIPSASNDSPVLNTPKNRHSYQNPDTSPSQRSPTLPIAEQVSYRQELSREGNSTDAYEFSQSAYYDRNSSDMSSTAIPPVASQTRRRELPVRGVNGETGLNQSTSNTIAEKQSHLTGPRGQPGRGATSSVPAENGSIDIPKRSGGGHGGLGGSKQLSTGSTANGIIRRGQYTKPGTASAATRSESTPASTANYTAEGKRYLVEGASEQPSLEGIVDLRNTTQTTVHTNWSTPVVHERIIPKIHHITHPVIERRIHNHDVHHRMLPIIDVQVLPAKHYAPHGPGGSLIEIGQDTLPGRSGTNQHWVVAETVSKLGDADHDGGSDPRKFSARGFAKTDGKTKNYMGTNGIPTTEQSWVHSPTIEEGARATGQTEALHFGEPRADGVFHERPEANPRRERNAEDVVAIDADRRAANGPNSRIQAAEIAYSQRGKAGREKGAERAILGAKGGEMGHRGMGV